MDACIFTPADIAADSSFLYRCMSGEDQFLCSVKLSFRNEKEFTGWLIKHLQTDFHDFYMVKNREGRSVGYVYNYGFSLKNANCRIVVYITEEYRGTYVGAYAALGFIRMLFDKYPLRKVYSTVYSYNKESLESNIAAGFTEEGELKDYRYYDGRYHSLHYLSLTREKFDRDLRGLIP